MAAQGPGSDYLGREEILTMGYNRKVQNENERQAATEGLMTSTAQPKKTKREEPLEYSSVDPEQQLTHRSTSLRDYRVRLGSGNRAGTDMWQVLPAGKSEQHVHDIALVGDSVRILKRNPRSKISSVARSEHVHLPR